MSFIKFLREQEKIEEETPTINTTSTGNTSSIDGDANFADKIGNKKKKKKKNAKKKKS